MSDTNKKLTLAELLAESADPGSCWRGAPFWALNGELDPEEIRRQIRGFQQMGLGGFFLHARTGLKTPYLSEKFFEAITSAIDEAEKCNMQPWLYDEDRYPSGIGGGFITSQKKYRAKGVFLAEVSPQQVKDYRFPETVAALFTARIENNTAREIKKYLPDSKRELAPDETLLVFYTDTVKCFSWYNNYTYLDTLSAEAVRAFIDLTHETYKKRYRDKFGSVIPGIFTDEPRYGFLIDPPGWDGEDRLNLPWTPGLDTRFQAENGYDFKDHLVEYFYDVPELDPTPARYDYIKTLTGLFLESFAKQTGDWCKENGLIYTGHTNAEDSLSYQTRCVGSSMRYYEHMGMPGIDVLTEHHQAYQTARQLSSAARQFGHSRRLAECYGCTGWDFPISGFYALGNWLYALGINFRCQHLALYTVEGEAKRDYPGPVALHNNAPKQYREMEDHFARLAPFLSNGQEKRNILLIHGVESAWTFFRSGFSCDEKTLSFDRKFTALTNKLLANQLDFDYGEEDILARLGSVKAGILTVGEAEYRCVLVPELVTIRSSTLRLIAAFREQGGKVFCCGAPPEYVDGRKQSVPASAFDRIVSAEEIPELLREYSNVRLKTSKGEDCPTFLYHERGDADWGALFICNTGHGIEDPESSGRNFCECAVRERKEGAGEIIISWNTPCAGQLAILDTAGGKYLPCDAVYRDGAWKIKKFFDPIGSALFIAVKDKRSIPLEQEKFRQKEFCPEEKIVVKQWDIELSEPNCALFDHFSAEKNGESVFVLALDDKLRREMGLDIRDGVMAQPWCRKCTNTTAKEIRIFAGFRCDYLPRGPLYLVMERPELYRCFINGRSVELTQSSCWHEKAWRMIPLEEDLLVMGENLLELHTVMDDAHPGLESVFLLGSFGVEQCFPSFKITAPVTGLPAGDWTGMGFPFYAGNIVYKTHVKLKRAGSGMIRITDTGSTAVEIKVNGTPLQMIPAGKGIAAAGFLPEEFDLSVTVFSSVRNACGPFFSEKAEPTWCGPFQFKAQDVPFRHLVPRGILGDLLISMEKI